MEWRKRQPDEHPSEAYERASDTEEHAGGTDEQVTQADEQATQADEQASEMDQRARALAEGIETHLPGWVERSIARLVLAWSGFVDPEVAGAAAQAGQQAARHVGARARALLGADVEAQAFTPLNLVREAVSYPTAVLRHAGVPPVERDLFAQHAFPDDYYGLTPASWADIDPSLVDLGLAWGVAKARALLAAATPGLDERAAPLAGLGSLDHQIDG